MTTPSANWIHMVGIGGAGMSGIAHVLVEQGCTVSGSDLQKSTVTQKLEQIGVKIYQGHSSSYVQEGVDLLVISSAIPAGNPEIEQAGKMGIPVIKRGQMLARMVNQQQAVAVAGAHGKTTTTSMIYYALLGCGLDPTFIVGAELQANGANARLGKGELCVIEADESDGSFLDLKPFIAVVTNIEDDHLDYYKSFANLQTAFQEYLECVKEDGFALVYGEDACVQKIIPHCTSRIVTYGEEQRQDYFMKNWQARGMGSSFEVYHDRDYIGRVELEVPGKHNALNALAAVAVCMELGLNFEAACQGLKAFRGAKRRFHIMGQKRGITVVDDYAHHPTEIEATIKAARESYQDRINVVFQPHRYTRTQLLGSKLGEALKGADLVVLTDIYAAGEEVIPGVSAGTVYEAARQDKTDVYYIASFEEIADFIVGQARDNDLIITMGAGDVWKLGEQILARL